MSLLADLMTGGGLGTIFSGISGLVGGYLTKRENRLTMIETNKHDLAMADVDSRTAEFELKASITIAKHELDIAQAEGEIAKDLIEVQSTADIESFAAEAFKEGMKDAHKPTGYAWVDQFRAVTRPAITWSLYFFIIAIFIVLHIQVGDLVATNTELLVKLYVYMVQSIIYLFIMAVSWWFMSRGEKSVQAIKGMLK